MASIRDLLSPTENPVMTTGRTPRAEATQHAPAFGSLHFTIEFILDTICPHCYIGLKNLNVAIDIYKQRYPDATFEVTCSPIVLNPDAGRSVDTKGNYYRYGRGFATSTMHGWTVQGADIGIDFDWEGGRTGNSKDSHKILRLALEATPSTYRSSSFTQAFGFKSPATAPTSSHTPATSGDRGPATQMRLLETIYKEYFENNHDVSDQAWLLKVAHSTTNIPEPEIKACLESQEWDQAIHRLSDRNKQEFNAVPVFIIQGRFVAGGWQAADKFLEVFERIRIEGPNAPGRMLSVPGGGWWMPGGVFRTAGQDAAPVPGSIRES